MAGYFVSALFAYYSTATWGLNITGQLALILTIGWISFFIGEFFVVYILNKGERYVKSLERKNLYVIDVQNFKIFFIIVIDLTILLLLYMNVRSIGSTSGSTYSEMIATYKSSEESISTLTQQLIKIIKGSAYIFAFTFVNNIVADNSKMLPKIKKYIKYLIPGVIYIIDCLLLGGRYTVLSFIIAMVFLWYFLIQYKNHWKYKIKFKTMAKFVVFAILLIYGFYLIREFVGRRSLDETVIDYIARYVGGSYELFSLYLENPPIKAHETFGYMVQSLNKVLNLNIPEY